MVESDGTTGYGSVAYDYKMGAYDVTVAQYVAFLNAVATTADTYGLYNSNMEAFSGALDNISITQSYSKKTYAYSFSDSPDPQAGNCPMLTSPGRRGPVLQLARQRPADGARAGDHRDRVLHVGRRRLEPRCWP